MENKQDIKQANKPEVKAKEVKIEDTRWIVRVCGADMFSNKKIFNTLRQIKGVSFQIANAVCSILNIDKNKSVGDLNEKEIKDVEELVKNPQGKIPVWMFNRRKDYETGKDLHLYDAEVKLRKDFDIKRLKIIKSRKGIRHALNLPVRGQRTKAHFRQGLAIGVRKSKVQAIPAAEKKEEKK